MFWRLALDWALHDAGDELAVRHDEQDEQRPHRETGANFEPARSKPTARLNRMHRFAVEASTAERSTP